MAHTKEPWYAKVDRDELHRLYHEDLLDQRQIAQHYGVSQYMVSYAMRKLAIPARRSSKYPTVPPETLRRLYWEQGHTITEMETLLGIPHYSLLWQMEQADIPRRPRTAHGNANRPWRDPTWLRTKYCAEGLSQRAMAEEAGCAQPTIAKALKQYRIRRSRNGDRPEDPFCNPSCKYWSRCLDWPAEVKCPIAQQEKERND